MKRILFAAVLLLCTAATGSAQDIPLSQILVEGEGWKVAAKDLPAITYLRCSLDGIDMVQGNKRLRISPDGKIEENTHAGGTNASVDRRLSDYQIYYRISDDKTALNGRNTTFKEGSYRFKNQSVPLNGISNASCLVLWPDDEQLVIGDAGGDHLWVVPLIDKEGKLGTPDRYYSLRVKSGEKGSGVTAMVMDARSLLYAATPLGVQVFGPTGRLCGVILPPSNEEMTAITIGGKDANQLFVACGDKIYSRKIQGKAAYTLKKDK